MDKMKKSAIWLFAAALALGTGASLRATAEAVLAMATRPDDMATAAATAVALLVLSWMLGTVTLKAAELNLGPTTDLPEYPWLPLAFVIGGTAVLGMVGTISTLEQGRIVIAVTLGTSSTAFWFGACQMVQEALGDRKQES